MYVKCLSQANKYTSRTKTNWPLHACVGLVHALKHSSYTWVALCSSHIRTYKVRTVGWGNYAIPLISWMERV